MNLVQRYVLTAVALFAALSAALVVSRAPEDDCYSGPWDNSSLVWVGGRGGSKFCQTKYKKGVIISGIDIWGNSEHIESLQFWYSDGSHGVQLGKLNDGAAKKSIRWDAAKNEVIKQLKVWGDGQGLRLGRIYIATSAGTELDAGKDTRGQQMFEQDVKSGVLLAAWGGSGEDIDSLALCFMRSTVKKIKTTITHFEDEAHTLNQKQIGLQMTTVNTVTYKSGNTNNDTFIFSGSETRLTSTTYTSNNRFASGLEVGTEFEVDEGVAGFLHMKQDVKASLTFSYAHGWANSWNKQDIHMLSYSIAGALISGKFTHCRALVMYGNYKGYFKSIVKIILEDGTHFTFKSKGEVHDVAYSDIVASCQAKPFHRSYPDLPPK